MQEETIKVEGARVHNLKNISVEIPREKLTVITGISGSGKSSLAFDTIHAEGQRRYMETYSTYARQFMGNIEKPDVDKISGLSPVISIEQKTTNKNPRSTVGTITEVYDFLRLLYARGSVAYSYISGEEMVKYTDEQILDILLKKYENKAIYILAPIVRERKGHYRDLFEQIRRRGYLDVRIDGKIMEIEAGIKLSRYQNHNVEVVVDKIKIPFKAEVNDDFNKRIKNTLAVAMQEGKGITMVMEKESKEVSFYSRNLMCPTSGISYPEPEPNNFSFNSPQGMCHKCKGLGEVNQINTEKIFPDTSKNIYSGGIEPIGSYKDSMIFWQLEALIMPFGADLKTPIKDIPEEALDAILYGSEEKLRLKNTPLGHSANLYDTFPGIFSYLENIANENSSLSAQKWLESFINKIKCPVCNGTRLRKEFLYFKINNKNISELANTDIGELYKWFFDLEQHLSERQRKIAKGIVQEIIKRLQFLVEVGLTYLSLNRSAKTLSGGESQRIRLATQIGSQLVNVLYILDEPSIGLHQKDNIRLIQSLKTLRDMGNTVIVVEHDKEIMLESDYIIDIGPKAGRLGGEITGIGTPEEFLKQGNITAQYLKGERKIEIPKERRKGNGKFIKLNGATGNNLKNVDIKIPLGTLICVTGVSGSGKSSLIKSTLHPIISQKLYGSIKDPLSYCSIEGIEEIDKIIEVDQSPIGRTPRSNPSTYTGMFADIRILFQELPESKIRGYKAGRFSFNVEGGRCEDCKGAGVKTVEMNLLPDVYIECDTCRGKRYNRETLQVRYKGKSIGDVLDMTVDQALDFFENIPQLYRKIKILQDVGLGYIRIGQASTTLSGGEAQRIKLGTELSKKDTSKTLYILDEPTTGLHFEDIKVFLKVIQKLVDKGNSVIIIEHNLDVIKVADYIIDIGADGGRNGGTIVCQGTPEEVAKNKRSFTAKYLMKEL